MGYDMVRFFERVPDSKKPGIDLPDMFFMLADTMLIFDGLKQKIKIVSNAHIDGKSPAQAYKEAVEKIDAITEKLKSSKLKVKSSKGKKTKAGNKFISSFKTKEAFEDAVLKSKEYIAAGDIFQVVLSQRFERKSDVEPFDVYRALRVINPSPYMYYIDTGDAEIVGSSPEILVRLEGEKSCPQAYCGNKETGRDRCRG